MTEHQADEIINILSDILAGLRDMRTEFSEFTGYNVYKMSAVIDGIGDQITGGSGGLGGDTLMDVKMAIDSLEQSIDLK